MKQDERIEADWQFGEYGDGMEFTATCECGREIKIEPIGPDDTAMCECGRRWKLRIEFETV